MTIKELRKELKKYPDDTDCYLWVTGETLEKMLDESADVGAFNLEVIEWKAKQYPNSTQHNKLDTAQFFLTPKECIMS